jgi:hypothetical protein
MPCPYNDDGFLMRRRFFDSLRSLRMTAGEHLNFVYPARLGSEKLIITGNWKGRPFLDFDPLEV